MPVEVPASVDIVVDAEMVSVKGPRGELQMRLHDSVDIAREGRFVTCRSRSETGWAVALAGTFRSLIANMVKGVCEGFEKKLQLVGVGYRAQMQGRVLNLALGFSHPVEYKCPQGVVIETPSQTEIVVRGADKQRVGQVAAEIRAFRPPEPYKGKGVRYSDEIVVRKEAKKKQK